MLHLTYTSVRQKFWCIISGGNISFSQLDFFKAIIILANEGECKEALTGFLSRPIFIIKMVDRGDS